MHNCPLDVTAYTSTGAVEATPSWTEPTATGMYPYISNYQEHLIYIFAPFPECYKSVRVGKNGVADWSVYKTQPNLT